MELRLRGHGYEKQGLGTFDDFDRERLPILRRFFGKYDEWSHVDPGKLRKHLSWSRLGDPKRYDPYEDMWVNRTEELFKMLY